MNIEGLYIIGYGLGGGFGGAQNFQVIQADSIEEAYNEARYLACEEYENYAGYHGLRDISQIMEDEMVDEEEAQDIYDDEMESWLEYNAQPYSKEYEAKIKDYHYTNDFKEITG